MTPYPPATRQDLPCLLFESAEIATFTPQEKIKLENDMRTERDLRNQIAYAEEKGREEGLEEGIVKGIVKGREEERVRIIEELRKQGYPEERIAELIRKD